MPESFPSSRRSFLKTAAAASAGGLVSEAAAAAPTSPAAPEHSTEHSFGRSNVRGTDFAIAYESRFAQRGLARWQVEQQPGGTVEVEGNRMVIDDAGGCTVWFREKLEAPSIIEYTVTPATEGRVSDVNCFWMATAPGEGDLLDGGAARGGDFNNYDPLRLYYAGIGGHGNTTTRFRRYPGDGTRPLTPEHDRERPLLTGGEPVRIRIVADGRRTQLVADGDLLFDVIDEDPLTEGWFGLRTVDSHLRVEDVRVLEPQIRLLHPGAQQTGLSYYGTSPESPAGRRVAYVRWKEVPQSRPEARPAELWVGDCDGANRRKLLDIASCTNHNGARVQWATEDRIAYMDGPHTYVADVETGERVHGPYAGRLGHHAHDGHILNSVMGPSSELGPPGVYEIDTRTGRARQVIDRDRLATLNLPERITPGPPAVWDLIHLQYAPDGSRIAMRFDPLPNDRESEREKFLATFDRNGNDPVLFGPKPMHFFWYDDETVMGHDNQIPDGKPNNREVRRWTRRGELVETLAGPGNHLGASADRSSYASDTWYYEAPVELRVYARDSLTPAQHVFAGRHTDLVWQRGAHVNPSFSRDGSRLYFNYPAFPNRFHAAYVAVMPTARVPEAEASSV